MRISDWSSDVCSSDLQHAQLVGDLGVGGVDRLVLADDAADLGGEVAGALLQHRIVEHLAWLDSECRRSQQQRQDEKQAPQDRKSVVEGKSVSVRVDRGGRRNIKKKKKTIKKTS